MLKSESLIGQLGQVNSLPSPPKVALQILEVTKDPEMGTRDLAEILQTDPALTTKILQIANSAAYARNGMTETVMDAVNLLGANCVSMLALGFSLKEEMHGSSVEGLSQDTLWKHTVATASIARATTRFIKQGQSEIAFLCGLLSRMGQLVCLACLPEQYAPVVVESSEEVPSADDEQRILGTTHHQVAEFLLDGWNLPENIADTIVNWGVTDEEEIKDLPKSTWDLVKIVRFADSARGILFEQEKGDCLTSLYDQAQANWNLTDGEVDRLFVACQEELQATLKVFNQEADVDFSCQDLLERARMQMVQTSFELVSDLSNTKTYCRDLEDTNRQLEHQSTTDGLTNLKNRFALDQELKSLDEANTRGNARIYSLVMMDIDKFKGINDSFGHDFGDEVLRKVGRALEEAARSTDFVARYGGEEFMVILPNCSHEDAASVAERFRTAIGDRRIEVPDGSRFVTASAGVATSNEGELYEVIVKRADKALYQAKQNGRNRTVQWLDFNADPDGEDDSQ